MSSTGVGTTQAPFCTTACQTDVDAVQNAAGDSTGDLPESALPREFRSRLHKMFERIERDFEREYQKVIAENYALQEKLEKFEDGDHPESFNLTKKLTASQLSHRIKQQYKQSTSRLISNLRPASGGLALPPSTGGGLVGGTAGADLSTSWSSGGSWKFLRRFSGHRDGIWEATCFRNLVATASADSTVRLWRNSEAGNCLLIYSGHAGSVNSVRFRDRGNLMLTCGGDGTAHLVRLPDDLLLPAQQPDNTGGGGSASSVAVDAREDTDVVTDGDHHTEPSPTAPQPPVVLRDPSAIFQSASLFPPASTCSDNTADAPGPLDSSPLAAADFLSGREQLVTASWDRLGRLYDLNTGQEVQSLAGHDHELTDVRCAATTGSCNSPLVVTSARDSTFRVWDFRQARLEVHVQQAHNRTVSTAQFLPGPSLHHIVSAGTDRTCRLWDLRNQRAPVFTVRTDAVINRLAVSRRCGAFAASTAQSTAHAAAMASTAAANMSSGGGEGGLNDTASPPPIASSASTAGPPSFPVVFALPLDNRTVRFIAANGARVGRIPRNITHGHTLSITSAAWAEEGFCNFFTTGFDHKLLGWQLQV